MSGDFRVDVRGDMRAAMADLQAVRETVVNKATYRALNRALDRVATEASREIRKVYNVRHRAVLATMRKRRASSGSLFAQLRLEGPRIGLIEFDARWDRRSQGATVRVRVRSGRRTVRGSFIATRRWADRSGGDHAHRGVFRRAGKARFPIRYLRAISIPQAFANESVLRAVDAVSRAEFVKAYEQQLRFLGVRRG